MTSTPTPVHHTLISADALQRLRDSGTAAVLLDCRFDLADTGAGRLAYGQGHLPGAFHLHLDTDLSGARTGLDGLFRGRHPLPDRAAFAALIGSLGITPGTQVVAYDAQGGMYAARAWWLLKWLGHAAVAVLDGGLPTWSGPLDTDVPQRDASAPAYPMAATAAMPTIDADALLQRLGRAQVIDARAPERFRGEVEPLDKAAGHIPGALNRFLKNNLRPDGRFKPPDQLNLEWTALLAGRTPDGIVQQCGSGVTACHNLLAMDHAGLPGSVLYPGSWSEWSGDPGRPIARA